MCADLVNAGEHSQLGGELKAIGKAAESDLRQPFSFPDIAYAQSVRSLKNSQIEMQSRSRLSLSGSILKYQFRASIRIGD